MELENYENAVRTFDKLFQVGGFEEEYYRDYAIALAYNGESEKAQDALDERLSLALPRILSTMQEERSTVLLANWSGRSQTSKAVLIFPKTQR